MLSRCCSRKPGEFIKSDPGTVLIVPWAPWSGSSLLASLLSLRFVLRSTLKNMLRNRQQEWRRSTAAIARLPQTFSPQPRAAKCSRASRSANWAAALQALVLHGFAWFCMFLYGFVAWKIWKHLRLMLLYTPKAGKSVLEMGRVVLPPQVSPLIPQVASSTWNGPPRAGSAKTHPRWMLRSEWQSWLVVWNINFIFPLILGIIIPIDFHIFQRGGWTTNQQSWQNIWKFRPAEGPAKDAECKMIKTCAAMCSHWIPFFNLKKHKKCRRLLSVGKIQDLLNFIGLLVV